MSKSDPHLSAAEQPSSNPPAEFLQNEQPHERYRKLTILKFINTEKRIEQLEQQLADSLAKIEDLTKVNRQIGIDAFGRDEMISDMQAQLEAARIPEGWQLVPIEPTENMLRAGQLTVCIENFEKKVEQAATAHVYRTMLVAAPNPR